MQEYEVAIREILERRISVEAESREMAEEIIERDYRSEKIILDSGDFQGMELEVREKHTVREKCR